MRIRLSGCVAVLALLTTPSFSLAQRPEVDRGETLVRRHCGGCHASGPAGESREPAAPPFRDLHRRYEPEMLAEALAEGILTGHPAMPSFRFEPDDVQAIIDYLDSIQKRQPS